jgi:hypothetical protein
MHLMSLLPWTQGNLNPAILSQNDLRMSGLAIRYMVAQIQSQGSKKEKKDTHTHTHTHTNIREEE